MKRPIAEIRKEIRELESDLTHLIISQVAQKSCGVEPEGLEQSENLSQRINQLKTEYPNWCPIRG